MIKSIKKHGRTIILLLVIFLNQSCSLGKLNTTLPALPTARDIESFTTGTQAVDSSTPTQRPTAEVSVPTQTETLSTATATPPKVTISAVKGNLFIRRGPDMAFNPIGVLYKDMSAEVIARDILSKWVQIKIPDSEQTGWASIQTKYSQIKGDISALPEFTTTEWPVPAYVRNCTYHRMYILPTQIYLTSSLGYPENEVWLYPGTYTIYDLDVPGDPIELLQVEIREGSNVEVREDALGDRHHCP